MTPAERTWLLQQAVQENAAWCSLGCASRGIGWGDDGRVWATTGPPPPYHPDAMTLVRGAGADEVLARVGDRQAVGVKDSFAGIDLSPAGFDVLFEASWIGLVGGARVPRADVRDVAPHGDGDGDVVSLEVVVDGVALGTGTGHRQTAVVGLSNVEADDPAHLGPVLAALVHGVRDRLGDVPVVGYEHGAALDAAVAEGFSVLGPLRVWVRPPAQAPVPSSLPGSLPG